MSSLHIHKPEQSIEIAHLQRRCTHCTKHDRHHTCTDRSTSAHSSNEQLTAVGTAINQTLSSTSRVRRDAVNLQASDASNLLNKS